MASTEAEAKSGDLSQIERNSDNEKETKLETKNETYIPTHDEDYVVTFKTWIVVSILSASYGISFWIVPALSSCQGVVATQLGDPSAQAWYLALYLMTITIAFMICGGMLQSESCQSLPKTLPHALQRYIC